jgi:outer membrane protein assembly factor BamB
MKPILMAASVLVALAACWGGAAAENSGGFRGPERNGIFPAKGLLKQWPAGGPKLLWRADVGGGYSGACVADGLVYFCGLEDKDGVARAFNLDGRRVWEATYGPDLAPNSTPVAAGGLLFYKSMVNTLYALDAKTGKTVWSSNLTPISITERMAGARSASPLVVGDLVVVVIRSDGDEVPSFAAFERRTGKLAWKGNLAPTPEAGKGWSAAEASPIAVRLGGRDAVLCNFYRGAGAVWADTGQKCWVNSIVKVPNRMRAQVVANEGYLFYHGTVMAKIAGDGKIVPLWEGKVKVAEYNISYSHTIIKDGRLIAFTPAGTINPTAPGKLRLLDAETGAELSTLNCAAKGSLLWADGMLYLQDNRPAMVLIEVTKDALREVSWFRLPLPVHPTGAGVQLFTPPVVAEGRLFVRDQSKVLVYDLRAPAPPK